MDKDNKKTIIRIVSALGSLGLLFVAHKYLGLPENWITYPKVWTLGIWVLFVYFLAKFEALYFYYKLKSGKDKGNEHALLNTIRLFAWLPIAFKLGWVAFLYGSMHPFIHDGFYYTFRHKIDRVYPKKFFAQSKTSTAILTRFMTPVVRTLLFVVSLTLYIWL